MDIRIDFNFNGSETVVRIAGRLAGAAVTQLKKACDPIEGSFVIDLSNLLFIDDEGIKAIRTLVGRGAQARKASPFIQLLLHNTQGCKMGDGESEPA
jgi:anti-anti-sigma regulatory factor